MQALRGVHLRRQLQMFIIHRFLTLAGSEGGAVLPLEMINEAYKANNPGLLIADVRYHGGLYVELTQTNQHVEYVYVDTIGSQNYTGFCGMAYDAPARQNTTAQLVIKPGTCGPVPGKYIRH